MEPPKEIRHGPKRTRKKKVNKSTNYANSLKTKGILQQLKHLIRFAFDYSLAAILLDYLICGGVHWRTEIMQYNSEIFE